MKKVFIFCCLFVSISIFGQTSLQDYNYLKKGYWTALNLGYELRKDVQVTKIEEQKNESIEISIYSLENLNAKSLCFFVWFKDISNEKTYSITIPQFNSQEEVKNDYFENVDRLPNNIKYYLIWCLYRLGN